ncbi:hypothetical protein CDL12_00953 [Handroanthus impetiginosus]|uniref:Uncharacterized protein n=1 Tax=Handroanthus impetiginosus TaxID=429701 RepID=A0A2G9I973_9LAMI|nr:hypothetical protein CDL12_00952 [Handroanthus impetiginosus]PIN26295.1 hypothetical protein CDL12_00953 [Handroanthus impetiginosus]
MGEMASLWGYEGHHEEQLLEQKLLLTTLELEKLKAEAEEEMRKNKEHVKQLINLLKFAIQERDEARNQLNKLLNSFSTIQAERKANSSRTESSNSLSFDAVSSPELISNINFVQDSNVLKTNNLDSGTLAIDNLVKGRVLPQKGKFLQAVLEAGPLLQTLLVAGPLPRWRNPPRLEAFQVPPVSIKGCNVEVLVQKPASNAGQLGFGQMSCGSNLANLGSGTTCVGNNASLIYSGIGNNGFVPLAKRQRFC